MCGETKCNAERKSLLSTGKNAILLFVSKGTAMKNLLLPIFLSHANRMATVFGLFGAIALLSLAIVGSFLIPTKVLGVFVSAAGCFAAGWVFATFIVKAHNLDSRDDSGEKSLRGELERERKANAEKQSRITALEVDNARLKHQHIGINSFAPILKLGLIEADMSVRDMKIEWMDDFKPGNMLTNVIASPTRSKYVGVVQRSFKAVYGVDLMKLKIREDEEGIRVAGIVPESIGIKDDKTRWLLRQAQTYRLRATSLAHGEVFPQCAQGDGWGDGERFWQIDKTAPFEGSFDLNKVETFASAQERELGDRINKNQGNEFKVMNGYIQQMAQGFVRLLLAPVKKPVVFVETPLKEIANNNAWLSLEDFANRFNRQLANRVTDSQRINGDRIP